MTASIIILLSCNYNTKNKPNVINKPNIIIIMADDFSYEYLSLYQDKIAHTPNIDKMGRGGLQFTEFHVAPLCTPTRNRIMTGKNSYKNYLGFGMIDPKQKTFGNYMKELGYKTCIAGKWQLGRSLKVVKQLGFDNYFLWHLFYRTANRYFNLKGFFKDGVEFAQDSNVFTPDLIADYVINFIETNKDKPFFCYYPMLLPHSPNIDVPDGKQATTKNEKTVEMIEHIDKIVGHINKKLEDLKIAEKTVVIFLGDNGGTTFTRRGKGNINYYGTHSPLIVSWPKTIKPIIYSGLIDVADILPTIVDLAGGKIEDEEVDGKSFFGLIDKSKKYTKRDYLYIDFFKKQPLRMRLKGEFIYPAQMLYDGEYFFAKSDKRGKNTRPIYLHKIKNSSFNKNANLVNKNDIAIKKILAKYKKIIALKEKDIRRYNKKLMNIDFNYLPIPSQNDKLMEKFIKYHLKTKEEFLISVPSLKTMNELNKIK